jgi:hypothetical protein
MSSTALLDEVTLQASLDSATSGALVFADKMAEAVSQGDFVELVVMAGQYQELRRVMRQLRALKAEVAT